MTPVATLVSTLVLASSAQTAAVSPAIASRDGLLYVQLTQLAAPAVSVRIEGGLASGGRWFGWVALKQTGPSSWRSKLRAPGFLGVYPLQIRTGHGTIDAGPLVRILPRGYAAQPGFFTTAEVADWWAATDRRGGHLVSASTWHTGFFTHRDPRFNLLVRVRVRPAGSSFMRTWFLSVARVRENGPWRLLEAVQAP
ncbi:MAG TPA: hypothetical protein VNY33_08245 [Gaiellaceae bacterium]|nr:hypothetical protein [Gaiellaceae bacterium]